MTPFARALGLSLSVVVSSCASEPWYMNQLKQSQGPSTDACAVLGPFPPYDPNVPPAFVERFPSGSQKRALEQVNLVFRNNAQVFHKTYEQYLAKNVCLRGDLKLALAILPDGDVAKAEFISSTTGDAVFDREILLLVSQMKFGPVDGDGYFVFAYPIRFMPAGGVSVNPSQPVSVP